MYSNTTSLRSGSLPRRFTRLARWISATCLTSIASMALAGPVGIDAFASATEVKFDNLPQTFADDDAPPLTDRGITFSGTPEIRTFAPGYLGGASFCRDGCVADASYPEHTLKIALSTPSTLMGLYVGAFLAWTFDVSFYSAADVLLGTEALAGDDSDVFVGFSSDEGIAYAVIDDAVTQNRVYGTESVLFLNQSVPEPATIGLLGVGAFGFLAQRRRSRRVLDDCTATGMDRK